MGGNFAHYLIERYPNVAVVVLDKLTYAGNRISLQDLENNPRFSFVEGDITDSKLVRSVIRARKIDVIVSYAAETHVDRSILEPRAFLETDVLGTFTLLEAVRSLGIKKFVQISTDEVFGSIPAGEFSETSPFEPNSPYAASKAGGDLLCRAYHATYGVPVTVTHSCNVYGPYQYPEKLIPLFITNLTDGLKVPMYGDGSQIREWIYVRDHCAAIDAIIERSKPGSVYNIGTRKRCTNLDLTKMLLKLCGKDESFIEHVEDRPGHDTRYAINPEKIERELGWRAETPFEQGLKQTVEWYQSHEEWWRPLKSGEYLDYYKKQYKKALV